ncbi:hypothetical protein PFTANZ_06099 [Plasmodium falciparum Tanzania (2000708)]|uniref:Duffy-binding-like domain-containing protein n=1 Tax=Plasmodium falciparum Tanzania (2000708) TaxID=1036725 RepID=A0A024VZ35_PLAFA|nr:hypothetical protein PFTANZ_06099 [Plasmodium falciparum Tanzania (2000708)]
MLKDSIHWRTKKLEKCLENGTKIKCKEWCNNDCDCFETWIGQKKENEWKPIKEHFKKQKLNDTGGNDNFASLFLFTHDYVLGKFLELQFLNEDTEENSKNSLDSEEIKHLKNLREMLQKENEKNQEPAGGSPVTEQKNIMDKLIEHELQEAEKCKKIQEDCENRKKQLEEQRSRGRSAEPQPRPTEKEDDAENDEYHSEDEEEEEEEDEDDEEEEGSTAEDQDTTAKKEGSETLPDETVTEQDGSATDPSVEVCSIVETLFNDTSKFSDACTLKYVTGKNYGWKCVPTTSGGDSTTTGSEAKRQRREASGEAPSGDATTTRSSNATAGSDDDYMSHH